jgi:iron(III) transport system ATP-binding protein
VRAEGVCKRFGDAEVLCSVDLDVPAGSMVALLGPSGCGKTTLLRILSGLEVPDEGEVRIGDDVVVGSGTFVAPERRRVGMVFQDWALFPHLTVERNVAYGLPRTERRGARVHQALAMVGLDGMGDRLPGTLSGGQQQRVALARAIAPQPSVLLLDEPFSNLDTALRVQVRTEVHELLVELGITTVFVTHDQDEAFVLGDQVAVMNEGRIVQQATPAELYRRPASPWVATFVGDANLLPGTVDPRSAGGALRAATALGPIPVAEGPGLAPPSGPVEVLVRPEELELVAGSTAQVELVEFYGHDTVYLVRDGDTVLRVRAGSSPRFGRADRVDVRYTGPPTVAFAATPATPAAPAGDDEATPAPSEDVASPA